MGLRGVAPPSLRRQVLREQPTILPWRLAVLLLESTPGPPPRRSDGTSLPGNIILLKVVDQHRFSGPKGMHQSPEPIFVPAFRLWDSGVEVIMILLISSAV